jgi:hypothetical protein
MGRPKGSKNKSKVKAPKLVKETKVPKVPKEPKKHPLTDAVDFIVENMSVLNQTYWSKEARKKNITLREMVILYVVQDFGMAEKVDIKKI